MPTPTLTLGRQDLIFPDIGHDPGTLLRDRLRDMFEFLSNNVTGRYFADTVVPASGNVVLTHNLNQTVASLDGLVVTLFDNTTGAVIDYVNSSTITVTAPTVDTVQIANSSGSPITYDVVIRQREDGNHPFILSQNISSGATPGSDIVISRGRNVMDVNLNWSNPAGSTVNVQNTSSANLSTTTLTLGAGEKFAGFAYTFPSTQYVESITTRFNLSATAQISLYVVRASTNRIIASSGQTCTVGQNSNRTFTLPTTEFLSGESYYFLFTPNQNLATFGMAGQAVGSGGIGLVHNGSDNTDTNGFTIDPLFSPWFQYAQVTSGRAHSVRAITAPRRGESPWIRVTNSTTTAILLGNTAGNSPAADKIAGFNNDTFNFYTLMPGANIGLVYDYRGSRWNIVEDAANDSNESVSSYNLSTGITFPYSGYLPSCSFFGNIAYAGDLAVGGTVYVKTINSSLTAGYGGSLTIQVDGDIYNEGTLALTSQRISMERIYSQGGVILTDTLASDNTANQDPFLMADSIINPAIPGDQNFTGHLIIQGATFHPWVELTGPVTKNTTIINTPRLNMYISQFHSSSNTAPSGATRRFNCFGMNCTSLTIRNQPNKAIGAYNVGINGDAWDCRFTIDCDQAGASAGPNLNIRGNAIAGSILMRGHQSSTTGAASGTGNLQIDGEAQGTITMTGGFSSLAASAGGTVGTATIGTLTGTLTQSTPNISTGASGGIGAVTLRNGGGSAASITQTTGNTSAASASSGSIGAISIQSTFAGSISQNIGTANGGNGVCGAVTINGNVHSLIQTYGNIAAGSVGNPGTIAIRGAITSSYQFIGGTNTAGPGRSSPSSMSFGSDVVTLSITGGTGQGGAGGTVSGFTISGSVASVAVTGGASTSSSGGSIGAITINGDVFGNVQITGGGVTAGTGASGSTTLLTITGDVRGNAIISNLPGSNSSSSAGSVGTSGGITINGDVYSGSVNTGGVAKTVGSGFGGIGGNITIAGSCNNNVTINSNGGDSNGAGESGPAAGSITIRGSFSHGTIFARGGFGDTSSGNGGLVRITGSVGSLDASTTNINTSTVQPGSGTAGSGGNITVGPVYNGALNSSGANAGTSGAGGSGGSIIVNGVFFSGSIDSRGGSGTGTSNGGNGGQVTIRGRSNPSSITCSGGAATGTSGFGGSGGTVTIEDSHGTGAITASGGNGIGATGIGQSGGSVTIRGSCLSNITSVGGNSTSAGDQGGAGGPVTIYGHMNGTTTTTGGTAAGSLPAGAGGAITVEGSYRGTFSASGGANSSTGAGGAAGNINIRGILYSTGGTYTASGGASTSGGGGSGPTVNISTLEMSGTTTLAFNGGTGATTGGSVILNIGDINAIGTGVFTLNFPSGGNGTTGAGGSVTLRINKFVGNCNFGNVTAGNGTTGGSITFDCQVLHLNPNSGTTFTAGNSTTGVGGSLTATIQSAILSASSLVTWTFTAGNTTGANVNGGALNVSLMNLDQRTGTFTFNGGAGNGTGTSAAGAINIYGTKWFVGTNINITGGFSTATGVPTGSLFEVETLSCNNLTITGSGNNTTKWLPINSVFQDLIIESSLTYALGTGTGGNPAADANGGRCLVSHRASIFDITMPNLGAVITFGAQSQFRPAMVRIYSMTTKTGALFDPVAAADEAETINAGTIFVYNGAAAAGSRWIAK